MERYIALLRGVNISGRNKIAMLELKMGFEKIGFLSVSTHLNSGNVVFEAESDDKGRIADSIRAMIESKFGLKIPVFVMGKEELREILDNAPEWWGSGDKEIYDNLIFMLPPLSFDVLCGELGEPNRELERVENYRNAVFWSFDRKQYQKTNWWAKTADCAISEQITIRTAGTMQKLMAICDKQK